MQEVNKNGIGQLYTAERGETVRNVQKSYSEDVYLQGVPQRNSLRDKDRTLGSQRELSGGQRDTLRSEESELYSERALREEQDRLGDIQFQDRQVYPDEARGVLVKIFSNMENIEGLDVSEADKEIIKQYAENLEQYNTYQEQLDSYRSAISDIYMAKNAITALLKDAINDEINGGIGLFYWDKKRAIALLSQKKVPMPNTVNTLSDGSLHSIHEKGSPVKSKLKNITDSQQFKRWFGDWRAYEETPPEINAANVVDIPQGVKINTQKRKIKNRDTGWMIDITDDLFQDSIHYAKKDRLYIDRILTHIDDVINNAIYMDTAVSDAKKSNKKGTSEFMHYLYTLVEFQGAPFLAKLTVEEYDFQGKHRAYNVQRIKMSTLSRAQYSQLKTAYRGKYASSVDAISIADLHALVKQYDKEFKPIEAKYLHL